LSVTAEQVRVVALLQATFKTPQAALRARLRGRDRTTRDIYRSLTLYIWAMSLLSGQNDGSAGFVMYRWFLQIDKGAMPLDGEDAVLRGIVGLTELRAFHGPRTRKRRKRVRAPYPIIRLNDAHYVTAWFVEQVRQRWVELHGWRRCPADKLDEIVNRLVASACERFDMQLSANRIRTIVKEPKRRRYTELFYLDRA
jgi:hypothetical protein